ncbi:MAG: tetratricopeptide repeat protein [Candidatus Omnitrophica bacterium]|nr:tetratricopeptide repeat protein [Candidatus Omnitrophota bacterium]
MRKERRTSKRNNTKEKIIVVCAACVAATVLLELALRLFGAGFFKKELPASLHPLLQCHTILCLGDSFTFGLGAPKELSYPRQLEKRLRTTFSRECIRVINGGVAAQNTRQLLKTLEAGIEQVEPDIIVLLTGNANEWNYWGFHDYQNKNKFFSYFYNQLYRMRVVKLAVLFTNEVKERVAQKRLRARLLSVSPADLTFSSLGAPSFLNDHKERVVKALRLVEKELKSAPAINRVADPDQLKFKDEIATLKGKIRAKPAESSFYYYMGDIYKENGDFERALLWSKAGAILNPEYSFSVGIVLEEQGKYEEALQSLKDYVLRYPANVSSYSFLARLYCRTKRYREAVDFFRGLRAHSSIAHDYYAMFSYAQSGNNTQIKEWMRYDTEEIVKVCKRQDIPIILLNYPSYNPFLGLQEGIAQRLSIPFLDSSRIFRELMKENKFAWNDLVMLDGHCTARGYGILASMVYEKIVALNLIVPYREAYFHENEFSDQLLLELSSP